MAKKKQKQPPQSQTTASDLFNAVPSATVTAGPVAERKAKTKKPLSPIACIIPNLLYLSPVSVTGNEAHLQRDGITHIISVGRNPYVHLDGIEYHRLSLKDEGNAYLGPTVDRVCEIIDGVAPSLLETDRGVGEGMGGGEKEKKESKDGEQLDGTEQELDREEGLPVDEITIKGKGRGMEHPEDGKRVLIHCSAAISRSPAVVAGYLMKSRKIRLREALRILVQARDSVSPNSGFLRQLCEMERDVFGLGDGEEPSFDPGLVKGGMKLATYLLRQ